MPCIIVLVSFLDVAYNTVQYCALFAYATIHVLVQYKCVTINSTNTDVCLHYCTAIVAVYYGLGSVMHGTVLEFDEKNGLPLAS